MSKRYTAKLVGNGWVIFNREGFAITVCFNEPEARRWESQINKVYARGVADERARVRKLAAKKRKVRR
jgi:hypothetical protein